MKHITDFFHQWNLHISMSPEDFKEALLAHHPNLPCFNDDVVIIFHKRICAGCLFAYPTAILTILLINPTGFNSIVIALLLAGISQIRRLTYNHYLQNFFRLIAGIALGFGLGGGYWAIINGQWSMIILLVIGAATYFLLKLYAMKQKMAGI